MNEWKKDVAFISEPTRQGGQSPEKFEHTCIKCPLPGEMIEFFGQLRIKSPSPGVMIDISSISASKTTFPGVMFEDFGHRPSTVRTARQ